MNQENIGRFIQQLRKEKGYTQAELADMLHVSDKTISRWETGKTMPDISMYEELCLVFDIQVAELLYGKRMDDKEKIEVGETFAKHVLVSKTELETLSIFIEILIVVGIIITGTFTKLFASNGKEALLIIILGGFVWGFGIVLRIKIRKALMKLQ